LTTTGSTEAPLRGSTGQIFDLQPPQAARRSRVPEVALGLLLVVGGALAALVWQLTANQTTPVLAVATDIAQGSEVRLEDLQLVEIRSDDAINVLQADQTSLVVGQVARTDLAAGTLLTPQDVTGGSIIEPGQGVVGLALLPGEYPSLRLSPGDTVSVVLTPAASDTGAIGDSADTSVAAVEAQVLVPQASVQEVAPLSNADGYFVSLSMTEAEAAVTARAASQGRVRLVEVAGG
jgi:hypothetical protein